MGCSAFAQVLSESGDSTEGFHVQTVFSNNRKSHVFPHPVTNTVYLYVCATACRSLCITLFNSAGGGTATPVITLQVTF